jgi:dihydroneopterin aldolase
MDKITVRGLKIFAYHGVNQTEQEQGQIFILDIDAYIDLQVPCKTDYIEDTVSYAKILKTANAVMLEQKNFLIERAAQRVAEKLLMEFSKIISVEITIKKPNAPIDADFDYTSATISRGRDTLE